MHILTNDVNNLAGCNLTLKVVGTFKLFKSVVKVTALLQDKNTNLHFLWNYSSATAHISTSSKLTPSLYSCFSLFAISLCTQPNMWPFTSPEDKNIIHVTLRAARANKSADAEDTKLTHWVKLGICCGGQEQLFHTVLTASSPK